MICGQMGITGRSNQRWIVEFRFVVLVTVLVMLFARIVDQTIFKLYFMSQFLTSQSNTDGSEHIMAKFKVESDLNYDDTKDIDSVFIIVFPVRLWKR